MDCDVSEFYINLQVPEIPGAYLGGQSGTVFVLSMSGFALGTK